MVDKLTPYEALSTAIDRLGSQAELARICEVSSTAAWKWMQSSKRLPAEYVLRVEAATGISRHLLRPDIYPLDMPPLPASAIAEPSPLCGPVLSTRMVDRQGKAQHFLDKGAAR
jgi:DNA-binding transcriptional regulator YdaS (Cro superfamily)